MNKAPSALTRVLRIAQTLESRLEQDLAGVGLSLAQLGVLRVLAEAGEALTLGGIAERIGCVRSNVTQLVDRLEAEGLLRRVADPVDRRVTRAALTPPGRRVQAEGAAIVHRHEAAVVEVLGKDMAVLSRVLDRLSR